jgi:hypothetical protein
MTRLFAVLLPLLLWQLLVAPQLCAADGDLQYYKEIFLAILGLTQAAATPPQTSFAVLGAGLGRTATMSTKRALERLGYHVCHGEDLAGLGLVPDFGRALKSQAGFDAFVDKLLAMGFNATMDQPFALLAPKLAKRFPNAKVLLTVRDNPEAWANSARSMMTSLVPFHQFPWFYITDFDIFWDALRVYDNFSAPYTPCSSGNVLRYLPWVYPCIQAPVIESFPYERLYELHTERIKLSIPEDRL